VHQRRVVVTGIGIVAPNGIGHKTFWENLAAGRSAIRHVSAFDPSKFPSKIAAEVRDFHPTDFITRSRAKRIARISQFALAASRLAVADAALTITPSLALRSGVCYGTSGGADVFERAVSDFNVGGVEALDPLTALEYPPHAPCCYIAIDFGITGPTLSLSSNCCTGLDVIHAAAAQIRSGRTAIMLTGSSEAPISPVAFATFCALKALSVRNTAPEEASRPYDLMRDGLVMSEGAATLILEDYDHATARGARLYAEILGSSSASESIGMRKGDATGIIMARAISAAIRASRLLPSHIDHVNAHGSSLPDYDVCDSNAFKIAFGDHAYRLPVSSIKSMIGQPFSAAGTLQTAAAALSIINQRVPPTTNQTVADPRCDLDYVPNQSRAARLDNVLVNSHSFGGNVSALVISRVR
jgi:3-oxoacyl-[acyl-carrier-protein] synthase II